MKKFCCIALTMVLVIAMASCINDEEATDLEIIAPQDSTATREYPAILQ